MSISFDLPDLNLIKGKVNTIEDYKKWIYEKVRPAFPHAALFSGYAHMHALGLSLDYAVLMDFPDDYLNSIRNRAGGLDSPMLRRWYETREPVVFEIETPWTDAPQPWLRNFKASGMQNGISHGVYDIERCIGTYHSFHRLPGRIGPAQIESIKLLVPVMHDVLCEVVEHLNQTSLFERRLVTLSARKQEIVRWVGMGKTNSEIASICSLSENTVKHYMTHIFNHLGLENRAQLIRHLADMEGRFVPGFTVQII